jgi:FixJ family two-component response regulator
LSDESPAPVVYLVDDDALFLRAAARLLRAAGFSVATFDSAAALLAGISRESAGCVVADLRMPGLSGLELQAALQGSGVTLPVVFLTGAGNIPSSVEAMRHGAEDYLEKHAPSERLFDAVRRALARDSRERGESERRQRLQQVFAPLTPREREVLAQVVRGRLNKQIAADLKIHERTVKLHRSAITSKLKVRTSAELARMAQEAGLFAASDLP